MLSLWYLQYFQLRVGRRHGRCIFDDLVRFTALIFTNIVLIIFSLKAIVLLYKASGNPKHIYSFVSVPPSLSLEPSSGKIVVRSGTTVALKCKASGNPKPKIDWRKRNDRLPASAQTTDGDMTLTMSRVTRHHSGIYECEASNGVGKSVKAEISLNILCE